MRKSLSAAAQPSKRPTNLRLERCRFDMGAGFLSPGSRMSVEQVCNAIQTKYFVHVAKLDKV